MIHGECLKFLSKEFLDDREIVELALKSFPSGIHFISDRLRQDTEFISNSIGKKKGFYLLPEEFSNDREIVLESIKLDRNNLLKASIELQNDREFILQVVKNNGMVLGRLKEEFKLDREIVLEAVKQNGDALVAVSSLYLDDEEIIIKAAQSAYGQINLSKVYNKLSDKLKNNREILVQLGGLFWLFPRKYQLDREIVMGCLQTHPDSVLTYASPLVVCDRVLAMKIVKKDGLLLDELPFKYRNDREIVSFAIQQNKEAFKFASYQLQNDLQVLKLCMK